MKDPRFPVTARCVDSRREWIDADAARSALSSDHVHAAQVVPEARTPTLVPEPPPVPSPSTDVAARHGILYLGVERRVVLDEVIGCGARTIVYRGALQVYGAKRPVAVKIFDGVSTEERPAFARRLDSAASRAACVVHPNVIATYDHGVRDDGAAFVVAELVDGTTLDRVLLSRAVPLEIDHVVLIVLHTANALAAAWSGAHPDGRTLALSHGSLCARDVFLSSDGAIKIADFGLSDATWESGAVRTPDALSPRLAATAPEIAAGAPMSAAADVFALGVLLHELAVGPRFAGNASTAEALRDVRDGVVRENPFAMATLPTSLRALMRRALDRDPALRFPDARAFAIALGTIARPLGIRDSARMLVRK